MVKMESNLTPNSSKLVLPKRTAVFLYYFYACKRICLPLLALHFKGYTMPIQETTYFSAFRPLILVVVIFFEGSRKKIVKIISTATAPHAG